MRNNFIIDYADYTDLQEYIKNNFIIGYADCTDLEACIKIISSLTKLTPLIIKITWKTALSLIQPTMLIHWLRWLPWYIDYAVYVDIQLYMKNNFV